MSLSSNRTSRNAWNRGRERITAVLGAESPTGRVTITIPNYLTLTRLIIVPIFWCCFFSGKLSLEIASTLLFAFGAITDLYDGKLARRLGQETAFGDFMDPLVDKLLVLSGFWAIYIRQDYSDLTTFAFVMIALITAREITLTLLRIWAIGDGSSVVTSGWGKWKTGIQLTTLLFAMVAFNVRDLLLANDKWEEFSSLLLSHGFTVLLIILFILSASISLFSGALYFRKASIRQADSE